MRRYYCKRAVSLTLAVIMATTAMTFGCGKKEEEPKKEGTYYQIEATDDGRRIIERYKEDADVSNDPDNEKNPDTQQDNEKEIIPTTSVNMLAVGDNLCHQSIWKSAADGKGGYDFNHLYVHVKDDIQAADIAVVNQETIFGTEKQEPLGADRGFRTPPQMAEALVNAGFDVVEQATNHTMDHGESCVYNTIEVWKNYENITVLGIHETQEDAQTIKVIEKNNIKIAMLDYTYGFNGRGPKDEWLIDVFSEDKAKADIEKAKEISDCVIVFIHWGRDNGPYGHLLPEQEEQAKFLADQGVLAIVGTHPHVVEPVAWVEGKDGNQTLCYYSLGNFMSRQASDKQIFEAMAEFTITKDSDGVRISKASVTPLVMHYESTPSKNYSVYKLEDYTKALAAKNNVNSVAKSVGNPSKFSFERMHELSIEAFGSDKKVDIPLPLEKNEETSEQQSEETVVEEPDAA